MAPRAFCLLGLRLPVREPSFRHVLVRMEALGDRPESEGRDHRRDHPCDQYPLAAMRPPAAANRAGVVVAFGARRAISQVKADRHLDRRQTQQVGSKRLHEVKPTRTDARASQQEKQLRPPTAGKMSQKGDEKRRARTQPGGSALTFLVSMAGRDLRLAHFLRIPLLQGRCNNGSTIVLVDGRHPDGNEFEAVHVLRCVEVAMDLLAIAGRTLLIYLTVVVGIRLTGNRQLSELTPFDFVVLLLLSESVQQGMVGQNQTLGGAFVSAFTLLLANRGVSEWRQRSKRLRLLIEGAPVVLIRDGQMHYRVMRREQVTKQEIESAMREQGVTRFEDIVLATLETDGAITILTKEQVQDEPIDVDPDEEN